MNEGETDKLILYLYCAALNYLLCGAPVVDTGAPRELDCSYATYTRFVCNVLYVCYNKLVLSQLSYTQHLRDIYIYIGTILE